MSGYPRVQRLKLASLVCLAVLAAGATPPAAEPRRPAVEWPAVCASYYTSLTDPDLDLPRFAAWLRDVGVTCTRAWLLDAWALGERDANGQFRPGQYDGRYPVVRLGDGRFDLGRWNGSYWTHLRTYVDTMNAHGIWPHLTLLELYTWSDRKADLPFVPTVERNLFRFNVNGIRWGGPDDRTFEALPDGWFARFVCKVHDTLTGTAWVAEIGNEMPDKRMHFRIAATLGGCGYEGEITVNRDASTPGQFWNMDIGGGTFSRLALHGVLDMGYLDRAFPEEAGAGRPTTFREAWPLYDASRVIISSDGGGGDPALLPDLLRVAKDALARGASYEHQLALKRNRFFGDGKLRMGDLALDEAFLRSLTGR